MKHSKIVLILLICVLSSGCRWKKNFYEVDKGRFFRSAQLTGDELKEAVAFYGIKTVINLRGVQIDKEWYQEELATVNDLGVKLISIPMRAQYIPHRDHLLELLDVYEKESYPMLVHCKSGSDRTGEATALYQMEYMKMPKSEAMKSLDIKYLHLRLFTPAKTYFIGIYQGIEWAKQEYFPCDQNLDYYEIPTFCKPREVRPRSLPSLEEVPKN